ncbi:DUF1850 domain-containing protein [Pasteurellaceae bacterium HPA106]|uniref:DUF1850 domain-containing protein n=1 Tax=Spirabiliibacterium pneumoniae TaxID=221400 RepID=UPI001AAD4FBF|nr:DUF1850 domain-containing protein [Spirabiliibacterium pneumoniae]MBE2897231.1 DUF1850 domain-containing protein [Spirabiliibacterium pneumoniae]
MNKLKCGLAVLGLTALCALVPVQGVEFHSETLHCLLKGETFRLRWHHSVEHQWWIEQYRTQGEQLMLTATWMQTFGAGTPSKGESISAPPGYVGFKRAIAMREINWMVSRNMQGTVLMNGEQWAIYQHLPDYSPVTIRPIKQPFFMFLWRRCQ